MSGENMGLEPSRASRDDDGSKCVRVVLRGGGSSAQEMSVEVARDTPISKIKQCYCKRYDLSVSGLKFLHDGDRLGQDKDWMTVQELDVEDGKCEIDVFQDQCGGHLFVKVSLC